MPRSPRTDPAILDRLRQARAAEDAALADITTAQARLDSATARRATVLADLDSTVERAEAEMAQARAGLVETAGLDRAALALGLSSAALRRSLPHDRGRAKPAMPHPTDPNGITTSASVGGAR